jgi:hypothetical protein
MPAPGKQSPSSPGTDHATPGAPVSYLTPAVAARVRQLAAQAEHHQAVADFRARRAADQQARINALLLEAIDALATLLSAPRHSARQPGQHHAARP